LFKTAIVGCGGIARTHATYLSKMENVEIVAVCDILNERAEYLKNTYAPNAQIFDDYVKMLDAVKPDVLHVCTPHYLHSEMAIAALKRDIHVLLEKPVSITMAQVNELIEAEKESNAKICISFQNRYLNRNKTAKQLIDSGKAGKVLFANGTVLWHRDAPYYIDSHWRGFMATEGGGVMINQAIHTLDLMLWMCGDPEKLTAMTANYHLKDVIDVEDTASTYITFKNGAKGMFYATTAHYTDAPISLEIVCENMKLELKNDDLYIDGVKQELYDDALDSDGKGYWGVGHMMLFNDFYSKLTTNEAMPIGVFEASKALKVLLAMYESNGKEITF
jgi:predicted dehydrogenase